MEHEAVEHLSIVVGLVVGLAAIFAVVIGGLYKISRTDAKENAAQHTAIMEAVKSIQTQQVMHLEKLTRVVEWYDSYRSSALGTSKGLASWLQDHTEHDSRVERRLESISSRIARVEGVLATDRRSAFRNNNGDKAKT